jgi:hypothetical protein
MRIAADTVISYPGAYEPRRTRRSGINVTLFATTNVAGKLAHESHDHLIKTVCY